MTSYAEKLKNPKWQKKRLQVFNRDKFTCVLCGDKETELHVNHLKYSGEPHEAKLSDLQTLCKYCHKLYHEMQDYKILKVVILHDDYYGLIRCVEYIKNKKHDVAFAYFKTPQKIEFISDFHLLNRDNMNYALLFRHGISVDFKDCFLSFLDFGGIDDFAYQFNHELKSVYFKKNKEAWVVRKTHSCAVECFGVKKIKGVYYLEYNGGAS